MKQRNANGLGTMRKRKDGRYEYKQTITYANGLKKKHSFYGKTKAEAIRKYKDFLKNAFITLSEQSSISVKDYLIKYFLPMKKMADKPDSYNRLCKTIEYQVIPSIGAIPMNQLTKYNVMDMLKSLEDQGLAVSTRKKAYYAINGACKFAMGEILTTNPCAQVPVPSEESGSNDKIVFLTTEEIKIFKKQLFKQYQCGTYIYGKSRWALLLELQTGMRPGEICGLLLGDISFNENDIPISIHICHKADNGNDPSELTEKAHPAIQNSVKTKNSNRDIPLNGTAQKAVMELIKINHAKKKTDKLVTSQSGGVLAPKDLTKTFNRVIRATKGAIPDYKTGAHTLRRTFATQLFEKGIDIKAVSKLLGHASVQTTYDIYIGLSDQKMNQEMAKFDDI